MRHVDPLHHATLTATFSGSTNMSLNLKSWRTTTALCVVSTVAVATAAYAASHSNGVSNWDLRPHHNRFANTGNKIEKLIHDKLPADVLLQEDVQKWVKLNLKF